MHPRIEAWLAAAIDDARRRGLPELQPLLEGLARSTQALREADERLRRRAEPDAPGEPRV
jgi:hypothetical protein